MDNRAVSHGMMVRVGVVVFGLLTLATLVLSLVSERGVLAVGEREQELETLEQRISDIEAENKALLEEIDNLRDPYGGEVERRAREELNLARPGEIVVAEPAPEE